MKELGDSRLTLKRFDKGLWNLMPKSVSFVQSLVMHAT